MKAKTKAEDRGMTCALGHELIVKKGVVYCPVCKTKKKL